MSDSTPTTETQAIESAPELIKLEGNSNPPKAIEATVSPVAIKAKTNPAVTPKLREISEAQMKEAVAFGKIDDEGRVWVKENAGERQVGHYPDGVPENPFDLYVRRYLDLKAQLQLAKDRLAHINAKDIETTISSLEKALESPTAVGDLDSLRNQTKELRELGEERKISLAKEREAAKAQALEERTKIVIQAEKIAAQDPGHTQWKQSGAQLRDLLDNWKNLQRRGPRLERAVEDELWKRFSSARTTFDRHRKQHFTALDSQQAQVKATKEKLIAKAEELSGSTAWRETSIAYRDLMDQWKAAGRASRKDDDELWARFRGAQQKFFDAREANDKVTNAQETENLKVKEALLAQAEALLPITDITVARNALRDIQDKWDAAGHIPRDDMARTEKRMKAVEKALSQAEEAQWQRSNPETKARAEGLVGQLEAIITQLEEKIEVAKKAGDTKKVKEFEENLKARKTWLEQASKAVN